MSAVDDLANVMQAGAKKGGGLNEDTLALAFAERHRDNLRFVDFWGKWLRWRGHYWEIDTTRHAYDLVRDLCREAAEKGTGSVTPKLVNGVHTFVQSDRRLAAEPESFDLNLDIMQTKASLTLDLHNGTTYAPRPDDFITKTSGCAVDMDMPTPRWDTFLSRITDNDSDLVRYLQRVAGYSLTGRTSEHSLFFLYGTGANGKSVFLNTLTNVFGDYAVTASIDLFMASRQEQHPTGLASLRGARIVVASETDGGARWSEAKIKQLTGGDRISARFMRGDFFQFVPQFKLVIGGNHVPALRHIDEALRRRLHLIPFKVTIPQQERDPYLTDKLMAEYPGILGWAVRGCLEWRRTGLCPPQAVTNATGAYLEAEDTFAQWLEECCERREDWSFEKTAELYASFKSWAEAAGERPPSMKRFATIVKERGFKPKRQHGGVRGFAGLRLAKRGLNV